MSNLFKDYEQGKRFYFQYYVKPKNWPTYNVKFPKPRYSKSFKTIDEAKKYWKPNKEKWIQARLYDFTNILGHKVHASIDLSKQFKVKEKADA